MPSLTTRIETVANDAAATRRVGRSLARAASPLPPDGLVVGLDGDLGAGKTVFVKGVADGLGVPPHEPVVSPTFTIARSYEGTAGRTLHHLDAYRLGDASDLEDVGFEDLRGSGCVTCVEWAERVTDALPADRIDVEISMEAEGITVERGASPVAPRRIVLAAGGPETRRILSTLAGLLGGEDA